LRTRPLTEPGPEELRRHRAADGACARGKAAKGKQDAGCLHIRAPCCVLCPAKAVPLSSRVRLTWYCLSLHQGTPKLLSQLAMGSMGGIWGNTPCGPWGVGGASVVLEPAHCDHNGVSKRKLRLQPAHDQRTPAPHAEGRGTTTPAVPWQKVHRALTPSPHLWQGKARTGRAPSYGKPRTGHAPSSLAWQSAHRACSSCPAGRHPPVVCRTGPAA